MAKLSYAKPDHRSEEAQDYRRRYRTARWQRTRAHQLQAEPLCQRCKREGRITAATICHHIDKTSKDNPETFFAGPFESRCKPCHDTIEQSIERLGYEKGSTADGKPIDPLHPWNR
jgi:5-methylcytosine-specific restriction protein A